MSSHFSSSGRVSAKAWNSSTVIGPVSMVGTPIAALRPSALHEDRAVADRPLALAHDAEALGDFGVGFEQAAEVAAEAILVELLVGLDVPQPAGIGRDLVGDDDAHHVVFPQP